MEKELTSDELQVLNLMRRSSYEELQAAMELLPNKFPIYLASNQMYSREKHAFEFHYDILKLLESHYWTFEQYIKYGVKLSILESVNKFNEEENSKMDILVNYARQYFPNVKVIKARIDLNE